MSRLVEREAVDSASVAGDSLAYWPSPRPTSSGNGTARPSEARMSTYQLDQGGGAIIATPHTVEVGKKRVTGAHGEKKGERRRATC
jgi:hypothetical protein